MIIKLILTTVFSAKKCYKNSFTFTFVFFILKIYAYFFMSVARVVYLSFVLARIILLSIFRFIYDSTHAVD